MIGKEQLISLESSWCVREDIVMHESMHCLGYPHEQSRLDRDGSITMQWNNVQAGKLELRRVNLLTIVFAAQRVVSLSSQTVNPNMA